jgi:anaerobic magnesium-protoporphyrin IX monomethyl ester cyclase
MSRVLLIYPYFRPAGDRSEFRFPPLGVAYLASSLIQAGHEVQIVDCTFLDKEEALQQALEFQAEVVGIYCMVTMLDDCLWFARRMRLSTQLLIAGGPLPTCDPQAFVQDFDVVVRGEGEATVVELLEAYAKNKNYSSVAGICMLAEASRGQTSKEMVFSPNRPFNMKLDGLPFPARHLLPNQSYIQFCKKKYGYSITTVMSTRGCPYQCEFCSNVIFGGTYRERSARNVVHEVEQALALGYERISFADDVFTLHQKRVLDVCRAFIKRGLQFEWECLARVDSLSDTAYVQMYKAGCRKVYFGIESGDDSILKLMNKKITTEEARHAVMAAHQAGLEVGAFFILFYPGDSIQTVLTTLHFATSLPLDYLGLSMPYPLPGTALYERVKDKIYREWRPGESVFGSHMLIYKSEFSETKMWFGIIKGRLQFEIKRRLGGWGKIGQLVLRSTEIITDWILVHLR